MRRPLVMRNGTSQSPLRTRFEPAHSFVPSPPAAARPRPPCGRAVRAFGAHQTLAHNGWTAFRVSLQVAFGHPPGPYASRGLLASVLRTFHSSQRAMVEAPDEAMRVQTPGGIFTVRWDERGSATALGQLAFFAEYLELPACSSDGSRAAS